MIYKAVLLTFYITRRERERERKTYRKRDRGRERKTEDREKPPKNPRPSFMQLPVKPMVFILDGCSFQHAHTWSKSGISIC